MITDIELEEIRKEDMRRTYETCLMVGIPIISTDTSARLMAVTYVHGNNEFMSHSDKFAVEFQYIQKRFGIQGGCVPDAEIVTLIQHYTKELEDYEKAHPKERYPKWATELFLTRYGVKLIN